MIGPRTAVLSLQNGWGNAPRIATIVGEDKVLVGLTYHSATLLAPGRVKHPGQGLTYLGELDGAMTPRLHAIADALKDAGFETQVTARIRDEIWKKLALNACSLPTAGLLRFLAHELVAHDDARLVMAAILREVVAVAHAQGIAIDYDERWDAITALLGKAVGGKASMLQDVEASRRTEIDVINGAIVDAGLRAGVPTPVNAAMVQLIGALQAKYLEIGKAA
jgi:2-dehydropantoate 2-reductase